MQLEEKISIIEAILFAGGDAVELTKITEAAQVEEESVHKLINMLNDRYEKNGSALVVLRLDDSYQLATRKQFAPYIKTALETKKNALLSQAALEALTIVAYNQPVTKSFVEQVRGVDSSGVINSLVEKELLEEAGRLELPGRPIAYKTTANFLRCFQLESLSELPPLPSPGKQMTIDEVENADEQDGKQGEQDEQDGES